MNGSQDLSAFEPLYETGPKPPAAVCCSEICKRGLRRVIRSAGVSKFAGSWWISAGALASAGLTGRWLFERRAFEGKHAQSYDVAAYRT